MRACFVVEGAAWSGATRAFADAATLLAQRGFETCFAAPAGSDAERVLIAAGHDVVGLASGGGWVRRGWRLRGIVARRLSEVLFVHSDREHLAAAAAIRFAGRGAIVRRTVSGERLTIGADGKFAMRMAATGFVFAHGDDVRGMNAPRGALAAHVAPPGVSEPASAKPAAGTPGVPRLLVIIGDDRWSDGLVALRALALLAPRLATLRATVITSAAQLDAARLQAAALGIAERVDWLPSAAPRDAALAASTLCWVIATADDAIYAMLDAAARGVPIVAERTPLTARVLGDDDGALLRHRADDAEWASVIAAALASPDALDTMRRAARRAAARAPFDTGAEGWVAVTEAARDRTRWTS